MCKTLVNFKFSRFRVKDKSRYTFIKNMSVDCSTSQRYKKSRFPPRSGPGILLGILLQNVNG